MTIWSTMVFLPFSNIVCVCIVSCSIAFVGTMTNCVHCWKIIYAWVSLMDVRGTSFNRNQNMIALKHAIFPWDPLHDKPWVYHKWTGILIGVRAHLSWWFWCHHLGILQGQSLKICHHLWDAELWALCVIASWKVFFSCGDWSWCCNTCILHSCHYVDCSHLWIRSRLCLLSSHVCTIEWAASQSLHHTNCF